MKKILIVGLMFMMMMSTIAFADEETYEVMVDGQLQGYVGQVLEDGIYIPYVGLLTTLGEENVTPLDKNLLDLKNVNGFDYISSEMIQSHFEVIVLLDDQKKELKIYSLQAIVAKLEAMEMDLKKTAPDLYEAINKTMEETYTYEASVNGILDIEYNNQQMAQAIGVNSAFFSMDLTAYMDTLQENFELMMDMKLDAAPMMTEKIQGIGIKKIGNTFYIRDPELATWTKEVIDENLMGQETSLMTSDSGILWLVAKDMKRTVEGNITRYKATYTEEDIKNIIESVAGQGAYQDLLGRIEEEGISFSLNQMEVTYVIENGYLVDQSFVFNCQVSAIQGSASLVIGLESSYSDYGVSKQIAVPLVISDSIIE